MQIIDLTGKWTVSSSCGQYEWEGDVPGSILYDLEKRGEFGEEGAFFGHNNRKAPELMNRDFHYFKSVSIPAGFLREPDKEYSRFMLEAYGLDTLTEIKVNGKSLGGTDNMHRSYSFDIGRELRAGENEIEITFFNTLEYIEREHARRPLMLEDPEGITTIPGFYTIRKSHCSYGWDWGPQIPDAGIWRPIRIVRYDEGIFKDLRLIQEHSDEGVFLGIKGEADFWGEGEARIKGAVLSPSGEEYPFSFPLGGEAEICIENPDLWWPNGMGEQKLYSVRAVMTAGDREVGAIGKSIGLRTLTVVREPDEWGESFYFQVNGIPLFARGANYIPEDIFLNRMNSGRTERLLEDCRRANFNCIRVWGGGVFPNDYFYDLCDRLGLIVWQDMMFACAIYDMLSDDFTENIREEIRDNLRRIRHHASLGLICGNNEMEWFFVDYDTFPQTKENEFEYIKQYHMVIPEVHREICPEIFYWSSSPSSGGYFEEPNSPDKGDCHFWAVWHGNKDFSEYKKHFFRFMSEFGFESLPGMKTIESFTKEEDRNIFSPVMEEHQKRVGGNPKIVSYLAKYFRYPKDLDSLAYVSQLSQSDAIRLGIEHWRRNRGRCMGSIYWQLNDNWPVASWSSIDYYGRWKALHYSVKKAYDNVLLSLDGEGRDAMIHLSNEGDKETGGELTVKLYSFAGELLSSDSIGVSMTRRSSGEIFHYSLPQEIDKRSALLSAEYTDQSGRTFNGVHFFDIYKYLDLREPDIKLSVAEMAGDTVEITLSCEKPALFVEIISTGCDIRFSDNFLTLCPGDPRVITARQAKDGGDIKEFRTRSLADSF